ncbi:hypothetical protein AY608_15345 [Acinetobacter terrae]|nr:hypothetical protein AY608_15345 [Acinetobacter terrae]
MSHPEIFRIKNMRLINPKTCEVYMHNLHRCSIKAWIIYCNEAFANQFYEQLNKLLQSSQPFEVLLQLKQYHKIEVLR